MPQRLLIELDKRQAEWVVTAYAAPDERMIDVCESNRDPHTATGVLISGAPEDFIRAEHKLVGHLTDPLEVAEARQPLLLSAGRNASSWFLPRSMSIRQAGKKSNHGLNYGMGYKRFSLENELDESEGRRCVEAYHRAYPGLRGSYYTAVQRQLKEDRTLENCFGRRRRFLDAWGEDLFKEAYSFIPQSTVVDVVNRAIIQAYKDPRNWMRRLELLAQVHDSVLFQYPLNNLPDMTMAVKQFADYMTPTINYHGRDFVIYTDVKIGLTWGNMYEVKAAINSDKLEEALRETLELIHGSAQTKRLATS